jgi:hypothetical protein
MALALRAEARGRQRRGRYMTVGFMCSVALLVQPAVAAETAAPQSESGCSAAASDWFKKVWPDGKASTATSKSTASYISHFNAKGGQCFMLVSVHETAHLKSGTTRSVKEEVFDVYENRTYGKCVEIIGAHALCLIEERMCKDRAQWELLVRAVYFEDKAASEEAARQKL